MIIPFSYDLPNFFATGGTFVLYTAAAWNLKSILIQSFAASPSEIVNDGTGLFGGAPQMVNVSATDFNDPFNNYNIQGGVQCGGTFLPPVGSVPFLDNQTHTLLNMQNLNVALAGSLSISYNPAHYNNILFSFSGQIEVG